jgi:hypothetical protein
MTKIIILVIIAIIAQVIAAYRKSLEEARRRAQDPGRLPERPRTAHPRRLEPEEDGEIEEWEPEPVEVKVEPPRWTLPRLAAPVLPAHHVFLPTTTTPLPPPPARRSRVRLDRRRLRAAIVLTEVLAPPLALRER